MRWSGAAIFYAVATGCAVAAPSEPPAEPAPDPARCLAAVTVADDDKILAVCSALIGNARTLPPDRLKALIARAGAYTRKDDTDRAIADYDAALRFDSRQAALLNARGELWRKKGDRPRAVKDFGAAMKLDPRLESARANYKTLAQEIERIGVEMSIKKPPLK